MRRNVISKYNFRIQNGAPVANSILIRISLWFVRRFGLPQNIIFRLIHNVLYVGMYLHLHSSVHPSSLHVKAFSNRIETENSWWNSNNNDYKKKKK